MFLYLKQHPNQLFSWCSITHMTLIKLSQTAADMCSGAIHSRWTVCSVKTRDCWHATWILIQRKKLSSVSNVRYCITYFFIKFIEVCEHELCFVWKFKTLCFSCFILTAILPVAQLLYRLDKSKLMMLKFLVRMKVKGIKVLLRTDGSKEQHKATIMIFLILNFVRLKNLY